MQKIHLLPEKIQNQIAAGEVVERPASIVKELLENALDAGSKNISIFIEEGGIKKIHIIDDGKGMGEEDAVMAFVRYATSKIQDIDDLFSISSFGFRGEALASIASVSNMILRTKQQDSQTGIEVVNSEKSGPVAMQTGTEIIVENLFWNVPARKKFLKSAQAEGREIFSLVESFALANPSVSFRCKKDGQELFSFAGSTSENALFQRVSEVLGADISSHLLPLSYEGGDEKISGFITHPDFERSNRSKQFFFVNGRIISGDKSFFASLTQSYETLIPKGKFPAGVVFLDILPEKVDVNVHPRKTEVKFDAPSHIFQILKATFSASLRNAKYQKNPSHIATITQPVSQQPFSLSSPASAPKSFPNFSSSAPSMPQEIFAPKENFPSSSFSEGKVLPKRKIIGQLRNSFIIVEEENGVRIIDQHAAHERIRYEMLVKSFREKKVESQPLLAPQVFSLSMSEKEKIFEYQENIQALGFTVEDFGGQEVAVHAVPVGVKQIDAENLFKSLLCDLETFDPNFGEHVNSFAEKIITYSACKGSIKFGDALTFPEMEKLLDDLDACDHPESCEHGRSVSVLYTFDDIENSCGRH